MLDREQRPSGQRRAAALSRWTCEERQPSHLQAGQGAAARRRLRVPMQNPGPRRPSGAAFGLLVSTACSRASDGAEVRVHRTVTSPPRERSGSLQCTRPASVELVDRDAGPERGAVQRIFFGDFLLGATRRKLPAIAGRIPAAVHRVERLFARASDRPTPPTERLSAKAP